MVSRTKSVLRVVDFLRHDKLLIWTSSDKQRNHLLIHVPREHDLVSSLIYCSYYSFIWPRSQHYKQSPITTTTTTTTTNTTTTTTAAAAAAILILLRILRLAVQYPCLKCVGCGGDGGSDGSGSCTLSIKRSDTLIIFK